MNVRDLAIKFTSYAQYIASREWVREDPMLPVLLCVVPEIGQERRMQRVALARLPSPAGLMVWTTTGVLLNELGPLAPIWLQSSQATQSGGSLRQRLCDVISWRERQVRRWVLLRFLSCRSTQTVRTDRSLGEAGTRFEHGQAMLSFFCHLSLLR